MSKVKTNCIKICIKTGNLKLLVLSPCRLSVENSSGGVYFQTLTAWSASITPAQWAGYLSALAADGKYSPQDGGDFGTVI
jgi:hypothetical protein